MERMTAVVEAFFSLMLFPCFNVVHDTTCKKLKFVISLMVCFDVVHGITCKNLS